MTTLRLVSTTDKPIEVTEDSILIGRDPACDVVLADGSVSRKHARVERRGESWFVVDQGSANGTFLDNVRVTETALESGQELRLGAIAFRVESGSADTAATVYTNAERITAVQPGLPPAPTLVPPQPPARVASPAPRGRVTTRPMPPPPEPMPATPQRGRRPWLWVGGGCCGCLVAILLVVGIALGYSYKKSSAGFDVVQALVTDIQQGDQQAAHGRLSRPYQEALPLDQFTQWTAKHPGLARNTSISRIGFQSGTGGTQVAVLLVATSGEQEKATFGFVTEDGELRIASVHFEDESANP
jgi:FHA domain